MFSHLLACIGGSVIEWEALMETVTGPSPIFTFIFQETVNHNLH
jgi:hypothetical protein